jgi:hypothetical protein
MFFSISMVRSIYRSKYLPGMGEGGFCLQNGWYGLGSMGNRTIPTGRVQKSKMS